MKLIVILWIYLIVDWFTGLFTEINTNLVKFKEDEWIQSAQGSTLNNRLKQHVYRYDSNALRLLREQYMVNNQH